MPKVGMKHFSYDEAGVQKAQAEAERTGLPLEYEDRNYAQYNIGGSITRKKADERAATKAMENKRLQKHLNRDSAVLGTGFSKGGSVRGKGKK